MSQETNRWSILRVIIHLALVAAIIYLAVYYWPQIKSLLSLEQEELSTWAYAKLSAVGTTIVASVGTAWHSYARRIQTNEALGEFFTETNLMTPPKNRIGYSDRMAYILAEMSELAYYEVEQYNNRLVTFFESITEQDIDNAGIKISKKIATRLREEFAYQNTHLGSINKEQDLKDLLTDNDFEFIGKYIHCARTGTQGFVCRRSKSGESPYIVVAFRGSEKKISDWLTNTKATPDTSVKDGKVHSGFYSRFNGVKQQVEKSIAEAKQKYIDEKVVDSAEAIPVFFTGHSLGGALATVAIREINADGFGAAYTFGAPKVGDYEYFYKLKAPVYRVVNSSDIVPRVPPGAYTRILMGILLGAKFVFAKSETAEKLFDKAIGWVNKLKDYRHGGDLRYLTDTEYGKSDSVQLLSNPSRFDRIRWFWRHIVVSAGMPVKSHSMQIYRDKLMALANRRNP